MAQPADKPAAPPSLPATDVRRSSAGVASAACSLIFHKVEQSKRESVTEERGRMSMTGLATTPPQNIHHDRAEDLLAGGAGMQISASTLTGHRIPNRETESVRNSWSRCADLSFKTR